MSGASIALAMVAAWSSPVQSSLLASFALGTMVLGHAASVWAVYKRDRKRGYWMRDYGDYTLLAHINIPGSEDSATWNYMQDTQDFL